MDHPSSYGKTTLLDLFPVHSREISSGSLRFHWGSFFSLIRIVSTHKAHLPLAIQCKTRKESKVGKFLKPLEDITLFMQRDILHICKQDQQP